jgi:hypothetical protein
MIEQAQTVHNDSLLQGLQVQQKEEMAQKSRELAEKQRYAATVQKELQKALDDLNKAYYEAKEKEKVESERAFATELIGVMFEGLSTSLGAWSQGAHAESDILSTIHLAISGLEGATDEDISLVRKGEQLIKDKIRIERDIENNKNLIAQVDGIKKDLTDPNEKAEKDQEIDNLQKKDHALKASLQTVENSLKQFGQLSSNVGIALQEKIVFFAMKAELDKHNLDTLARLEEYALQAEKIKISYDGITVISSETIQYAIDTIQYTIDSLAQISVALNQFAMFWKSIASCCLQAEDAKKFLNILKDVKNVDKGNGTNEYSTPRFMLLCVQNLSRWVALHSVCQQYLQGVREAYKQVGDNIKASPSVEKARQQGPVLAKKILESVRKEIKILDLQPNESSK